ncbi:MAG: hypothetical protein JNL61_05740, partial [Rhizobiaceae bacterium]|nr:hypothetical protein [Rhizobiaceae bacterium]
LAAEQDAIPALFAALDAVRVTGASATLVEPYRERIEAARAGLEPSAPLTVAPEPPFWLSPGK